MQARFCEVVHEAVFEITNGMDEGTVVRLPFVDGEEAEGLAPAVAELLNNPKARQAARHLYAALTLYLDDADGSESGVAAVKKAAAVINSIEMLRVETRQPVA